MSSLLVEIEKTLFEKQMCSSIALCESVDKMVGTILATLKNNPQAFKTKKLDIEDTAATLAGLLVLGKQANIKAYDEFADPANFFKFLDQLGEPGAKREFDKNHSTADDYLKEIGRAARSALANVKMKLEKGFMSDAPEAEADRKAFMMELEKIAIYYGKVLNSLKTHQIANKMPPGSNLAVAA